MCICLKIILLREKYIDENFDRDLEIPRDEILSKIEEEFVKHVSLPVMSFWPATQ